MKMMRGGLLMATLTAGVAFANVDAQAMSHMCGGPEPPPSPPHDRHDDDGDGDDRASKARASFDALHYPEGPNARFGIGKEPDAVDVGVFTHKFEKDEMRDIAARKELIIDLVRKHLPLDSNGQTVGVIADVGSGTGLMLEPLANICDRVMAVELSRAFVDHLQQRVRETPGLGEKVTVVQCSQHSANLPANSIDVALLCDVYHHIEFPQDTMTSIHDALAADGVVIVIDFHRPNPEIQFRTPEWLMAHVRAGQQQFTREIEQAGFQLFKDYTEEIGLVDNYVLAFRKKKD